MRAAIERGPTGWRIDPEVTGVAIDSRAVVPGNVFVAIPGASHDGHLFVTQAVSQGAIAIVGERLDVTARVPYVVVSSSRMAAAELADAFYGHPSQSMRCVAVTGTNGKTSVVYWLTHVLRYAGFKTGMVSSVVNDTGLHQHPATLTTPESPDLQQYLAEMRDYGMTHAVVEVSSHGIVQQRVRQVCFEMAVLTNITREHLDFHGSMDRYVGAKSRLFEELSSTSIGVLNAEDQYYMTVRQRTSAPIVTYGIDEGQVRAVILEDGPNHSLVEIVHPMFRRTVKIPHPGRYNIFNVLAVTAAASWFEVPPDTLIEALEHLPPVPGRWHVLQQPGCPMVVVDYAHTPDGLLQVLKSLGRLGRDSVWLVLGARGGRDHGKRPEMGRIAASLADHVILTTDSPYAEDPAEIAESLAEGIREVDANKIYRFELDRTKAITLAIESAAPGDVVLITGRGPETIQHIGSQSVRLVDAEVVEHVLISRNSASGGIKSWRD